MHTEVEGLAQAWHCLAKPCLALHCPDRLPVATRPQQPTETMADRDGDRDCICNIHPGRQLSCFLPLVGLSGLAEPRREVGRRGRHCLGTAAPIIHELAPRRGHPLLCSLESCAAVRHHLLNISKYHYML